MYDDDDYYGGPGWRMQEITGGSLFEETYQCVSVANLPDGPTKATVEYGNKTSALDTLSRLNIMYPMMFAVSNEQDTRSTHCGVLEFSAPEGIVYLPPWMLKTLKVRSGELVNMRNVALPLGTFIKIQPQSVDFLDITDPRAVLEHSLRNFATLTKGDVFAINYNNRIHELLVMETKPDDGTGGICVLETDLQVDFAPPIGYVEPTREPVAKKSIAGSLDQAAAILSTSQMSQVSASTTGLAQPSSLAQSSFTPFQGSGHRLSNRPRPNSISGTTESKHANSTSDTVPTAAMGTSPVPLKLPTGTLVFGVPNANKAAKAPSTIPNSTKSTSPAPKAPPSSFSAFTGQARKLQ